MSLFVPNTTSGKVKVAMVEIKFRKPYNLITKKMEHADGEDFKIVKSLKISIGSGRGRRGFGLKIEVTRRQLGLTHKYNALPCVCLCNSETTL